MWVPPEIKDPILQHAPTRKSVACFGAISVGSGQFVRMMCTIFNAATFPRPTHGHEMVEQVVKYGPDNALGDDLACSQLDDSTSQGFLRARSPLRAAWALRSKFGEALMRNISGDS